MKYAIKDMKILLPLQKKEKNILFVRRKVLTLQPFSKKET